MPQVEFYILNPDSDKHQFAIKLIDTLYQAKRTVFVHCDNQKSAEHFDTALWGHDDDSFMPHNIQGEGPTPPPPIQIGYKDNAKGFYDCLLLLSSEIPAFSKQFKNIIEIVDNSDETKQRLRTHYRQYQSLRYNIRNIKEEAFSPASKEPVAHSA